MGLLLGRRHRLICIVLSLCKHTCKSVCDVYPGIDPGLSGGNTTDEENYLSNFINEYFQLLATEASVQGLQAEAIGWDTFEKVVGHRPANNILKGKAPLLEQDIVLVPLNPGLSKDWSLLVVKPKEKKMFVINSLAASFVKPSTKNAISKMWDLLQEIDPKLDPEEWHFSTHQRTFRNNQIVMLRCLVISRAFKSTWF